MSRTGGVPALMGLLTFFYSLVGVSVPSFWTDEAATVSAINRDFSQLLAMLGKVDAVHGLYYVLMYGWTRVLGLSEFSLRLPSLIAIAVAAGLLTSLCRRVGGSAYGVAAAVVFAILPRVQYVATDARSYALTVLGAVLATYLLVVVRESPSKLRWLCYGLTGLLTVSMSFYVVLVVVAHAITMLLDERLRRQWRSMAVASVAWIVPAALIAAVASRQQFQIAWVPPIGGATPFEIVFIQFFSDAYYSAANFVSSPRPTPGEDVTMYGLAALVWGTSIAGTILARKHFVTRLAAPWLVLPLAMVICGSALTGRGYYLPRYMSFELAALPMLAAAPLLLGQLKRSAYQFWLGAFLPAALLISLPSYIGQRTEYGRDPSDDFSFIAETVHNEARPGDAFVISNDRDMAFRAYPADFQGLNDPTLILPAAQWGRIFDRRSDVMTAKNQILKYETVWVVELAKKTSARRAMKAIGYTPRRQFVGPTTSVIEFERPPR